MQFFHRQLQLEDLTACYELLSDGAGRTFPRSDLLEIWSCLLRDQSVNAALVEDRSRTPHVVAGFGMSICVPDAFVQELEAHPPASLTGEILARWKEGRLPAFSLKEIRAENQNGGVNVLALHTVWGSPKWEPSRRAPVRDQMLNSLFASHRGYNIRRFLKEVCGDEEYRNHLRFGLNLLGEGPDGTRLMGVSREEAMAPDHEGKFVRELFRHTKPTCQFTPADQELLQLAVAGLTESQIAEALGIKKESVKSRWDSVYQHVPRDLDRALFLNVSEHSKGRFLLNWLRNHPEELVPRLFFPGLDLIGDRVILSGFAKGS